MGAGNVGITTVACSGMSAQTPAVSGVQTLAGSTCSRTQLQLGRLDEDKMDTLLCLNLVDRY